MSNPIIRDFNRLATGLTLIAKELITRSETATATRNGEFRALVKQTLVAATDLTGLTKGKVREFNHDPNSISSSSEKENGRSGSVVYFDNESPEIEGLVSGPGEGAAETQLGRIVEDEALRADLSTQLDELSTRNANLIDAGVAVKEPELEPEPRRNVEAAVAPFKRRRPRERKVPSTPFTRALGFAGLGAGLAWGTVEESAKRVLFGKEKQDSVMSPFLSEKNAERLALALCRMRGAALKIGQMLSIQDESLVPAPILAALEIVRQGADVMPRSQLDRVLDDELGKGWSTKLRSFDYEPLAAASIGQVHKAVTREGLEIAMKIQYPGVANSIESDIENVKLLLDYTNLIPEGLYLDRAITVAKDELARECDYELEAANQRRFRELLSGTEGFYVPFVVDELASKRVLTTELISGVAIDKVALSDQRTRNYVGRKLLELTLRELFVFRFMQTDPNWGNFLYDEDAKMINLIDFGAARDYPKRFVDDYLRMVLACGNRDRDTVLEMSRRLGFLTGMEADVMLDAHVQAGFIVGLPFSRLGGYDFRSTNVTHSMSDLGATMLKHRLTAPPDEAYSLHRKLSGAFLACVKLGAVVPCRELLLEVYENYRFGDDEGQDLSISAPTQARVL
ncbi:hypothetical protein Droror1_Dr00006094 [Drosera rotundifolia]